MTLRKSSDLIAIAILTIAAAVLIQAGIHNFVRVLFVLPLVLFFPGYALVAAMFPDRPFPIETHVVFAIALSIACTILGGLMLNFLPWGLQTTSWLLFLTGVILVAVVLGIIRRYQAASSAKFTLNLNFNWQQIALLGLAVVMTFGAIQLARNGVASQPRPGFTQLWLLPATSDAPSAVQLGVRNEEETAHNYRLVISSGSVVIKEWQTINLMPDQQWNETVDVNSLTLQPGAPLEALLYRDDSPYTVYRNVSLVSNPTISTYP
jgi:uncharacterized membrane protein